MFKGAAISKQITIYFSQQMMFRSYKNTSRITDAKAIGGGFGFQAMSMNMSVVLNWAGILTHVAAGYT